MRIGIDARLIEETGVGRYIRNLIAGLIAIDKKNEYVVFLRARSFDAFAPANERWAKVRADVPWHTLSEQMSMPGIYSEANLDLLHVPYHNPPVLYDGRMVVTIHDLTILHFNTGKATTLPMPLYTLKRLGYWTILSIGLRKAYGIITVSETTKREIMDHFRISPEKISVTYEGVDEKLITNNKQQTTEKRLIKEPYFLYVGNAYPHKNLETLLSAFASFHKEKGMSGIKLVLVGNDDFFYRRLKKSAEALGITDAVVFYGPAKDEELAQLYRYTTAFVFPSLMEGFGLPALEALSFGCPVLVSDISVFHEVLGEYATYMDSRSAKSIAVALREVLKRKSVPAPSPSALVSSYSWSRLAKETLSIYERSARL